MEDATPLVPRGRWQVLIVDDAPDVRDTFRDLLEDEGFTVIEAENGVSALAILRSSRYPLIVLLDFLMPGMRGDTVIETLIKEHRLPGKHALILFTASPSTVPRSVYPALNKLDIPIISKDISPEEMFDLLDQASARITLQQQQSW
jgi:CheY-like chemotaxis protein